MDIESLKEYWIEELLEDYPESQQFLEDKDIVCIKCGAPVWGTVYENIAKKYVTKDIIDSILDDFLKFIENL